MFLVLLLPIRINIYFPSKHECMNNRNFSCISINIEHPIIVPPRWTVEPTDKSAVLGSSVSLNCKADGFPIPTVNWKQAIGIRINFQLHMFLYLKI